MLVALNDLILSVADALLGWMLVMPAGIALLVIATATGALLTFARLFTTDQDMLGRIAADKARQKELTREARKRGDKEAAARHRATIAMLAGRAIKYELKPILVSLPAIAILGVWAFSRLGYVPPRPGEPVGAEAYFSPLALGEVAHIVPQEGLEAPGGWVQRIVEVPADDGGRPANVVASWTLVAREKTEPYAIEIRQGGHTHTKELLVNGRGYSPPIEIYGQAVGDWGGPGDELERIELRMAEYVAYGFVPGIPWIGFRPWLVAYLAIAVVVVFGVRWAFGIH